MTSDVKPPSSTTGIKEFAAVLIVLALFGAGAGFSLKFVLPVGLATNPGGHGGPENNGVASAEGEQPAIEEAGAFATEQLLALEPILVTLAEPKGVRIRLETFVIFSGASKVDRAMLLREMAQDLLVFLKTTTLAQIQTASGLEYLREDLSELVQLRSKGLARGLVIKALVVE